MYICSQNAVVTSSRTEERLPCNFLWDCLCIPNDGWFDHVLLCDNPRNTRIILCCSLSFCQERNYCPKRIWNHLSRFATPVCPYRSDSHHCVCGNSRGIPCSNAQFLVGRLMDGLMDWSTLYTATPATYWIRESVIDVRELESYSCLLGISYTIVFCKSGTV